MTSPACRAGPLDGVAQAGLVQGADQVQALLDQSAEAGVLGHLGRAGRPARSPAPGRRRASSARRSRNARRSSRSSHSGEDLLGLVDGEHGAGSARSPGSAESACIGRRPGVISTTRWPRPRSAAARRRA